MENISKYLDFLKNEHLEEVAVELNNMSGLPSVSPPKKKSKSNDQIDFYKKYVSDICDALKKPDALQQAEAVMEKFVCGIMGKKSKEHFLPCDLVVLFSDQKKVYTKFLHLYTGNVSMAITVIQEFDMLYADYLQKSFHTLFAAEKAREKDMEQSNSFLSAILENIPNMIFVKDAEELRFVKFNHAGEDLLGFSKEEMIGKNDYDFFPAKQADFFTAKDRAVLISGKMVDISEEPISTRNLGERWLHTKKIPIAAQNGSPGYLLGISEDITEKKKQEDSIRELNHELEAFSYSVSHDLRAPLRAVNGYVQILQEDHGSLMNEEMVRLVQIIKYNAKKMETLIDDLLSFSRLGRKEMVKSDIDMNELTEGVLREINRMEPVHHAKIILGKLQPIKADYGLIHQVVFNLVSNAVKYSSKKENPEVEISSRQEGSEVIYEVKDNGSGFNMAYASKLFGVFQRLHRSDEFEGTGVGLAIVKRIVNRHGGAVGATGASGIGATFTFSLPIVN
jgi:PAS domain S-box-containing protein